MKNSSLDSEPPSKFEGKKEVNKKKNGTGSPLIILLKNDRSKIKIITSAKNLEKKVISNGQKNISDVNYLKNDEYALEENFTLTNESIKFTKQNMTCNQAILNLNYIQKEDNISFTGERFPRFYDISSSYSFTPQIKEENKKESLPSQQIEQETKEISYILYNFEEEAGQKN